MAIQTDREALSVIYTHKDCSAFPLKPLRVSYWRPVTGAEVLCESDWCS